MLLFSMGKECAICDEYIFEDAGKLDGAQVRVLENKKIFFIYVCSECQKKNKNWIEKAKIRSAYFGDDIGKNKK